MSSILERVEAASVSHRAANQHYSALVAQGIPEDDADEAAGLAATSDALSQAANVAYASGDAFTMMMAAVMVAEAGLPVPEITLRAACDRFALRAAA